MTSGNIDDGSSSRAFYQMARIHHPDAWAPSSLSSRTVTLPLNGGTLTYAFNATGLAGTTTYTPDVGDPLTSPVTVIDPLFGVHRMIFIADSPGLNPRYLQLKIGCDSDGGSVIDCHHITTYYNGFDWSSFAQGNCNISK